MPAFTATSDKCSRKERRPANSGQSNSQRPLNWSPLKKVYHTIVPSLFAFLTTFSTSTPEPALPSLIEDFGINHTTAILSVSLYTIGLAIGPLFLVPLSETYGRRWIYVTASSSLVAFSAGAGAAHNFAAYLICRFFSGCLGSASIALGAGTISDLWPPGEERAVASLLFVACPFLAPSLGPLVGAYITNAHGGNWRWTQWILVFVGLPIWAMVLLMQETMAPQESHRFSRKMSANPILLPFRMLFSDWIIMALSMHTSFGYAIIFSFFSSFFYVLKNKYGFETREASLCFLGLIIGYFLAIMMFLVMEKTIVGSKRLTSEGRTTPERRLYSGIIGAVLLLVGELWYSLASHWASSWHVLASSGIFVGWGVLELFLSAMTYISHIYPPESVASAIAANGALRYSLGAAFPLFTVQMYEELGSPWASGIFALLSLLLMPIPWLLCKYGERLRRSIVSGLPCEEVPTTVSA